MGIFGQSTPFDADVEKATSETNTNENWSLFLDVCDKVTTNPRSAKDCLKAIMKRMAHADPHVVMQAITLLDACANNCGKPFHLEIASRDFENEYRRLLKSAQPKIASKMRQVLKNWAENDFKNDPELNLIPSFYQKLRSEGHEFSNLNDKPSKSTAKMAAALKDPNVVSSQQEEEDIAKAIELSLKESKSSPKKHSVVTAPPPAGNVAAAAYPSLYPNFTVMGSVTPAAATAPSSSGNASINAADSASAAAPPEPRRVRALYDFEAAEENELTFLAGEIIHVTDDTDPNWWKGYNQRGDGLFPANFVTADLSVEPERFDINQQQKSKTSDQIEADDLAAKELQQKTEAGRATAAAAAVNQPIEINEIKIDRLLHLLHEANPQDPSQDTDEMKCLEQEVHKMGPLIDAELERVDRKHAQLTQLSVDLVDAINLYHSLMRDDRVAAGSISVLGGSVGGGFGANMPGAAGLPLGLGGYQPNPHTLYNAAGYPGAAGGRFPLTQPQMGPSYAATNNFGSGGQMVAVSNAAAQHNNAQIASLASVTGNEQGAGALYTAAPQMPAQMISMQYQNGSVNTAQLAGAGVMPQSIAAPPMPPQHLYAGAAQHQQQTATHQQQNYQMVLPQQQQQQQQQHQQQQQFQHSQLQQMHAATIADQQQLMQGHPAPPSAQQQQQFSAHQQAPAYIHSQQQQQQQQPFLPMPNGSSSFILSSLQPRSNNNNNNNATTTTFLEQQQQQLQQQQQQPHLQQTNNDLSQLQQQMAVMAMAANSAAATTATSNTAAAAAAAAAALSHPAAAAQNYLAKNETQNNIPIYQQQR